MRRRTFLASSVPLAAAAAGCLGGAGPPGAAPGTGTGADDADPTTPGQGTTDDGAGPAGEPPTPEQASDVFAGRDCPSFDDSADRTVCYHAVDPSAADVLVGVSPEVFDPDLEDRDVETLRFTLYNRSEWHFHFNHYAWGIERHDEGSWTHVAPDAYPEPLMELPPGGTYTWELPSEPHPSPSPDRYMLLDVALAAGVYAFHVAGTFGAGLRGTRTPTEPPTSEPSEERVECVGLFRLDDDVDPGTSGGTPRPTETGTEHDG